MTAHCNHVIQAWKLCDSVHSSAGSLEATACDATRFGILGDFGLVFFRFQGQKVRVEGQSGIKYAGTAFLGQRHTLLDVLSSELSYYL